MEVGGVTDLEPHSSPSTTQEMADVAWGASCLSVIIFLYYPSDLPDGSKVPRNDLWHGRDKPYYRNWRIQPCVLYLAYRMGNSTICG